MVRVHRNALRHACSAVRIQVRGQQGGTTRARQHGQSEQKGASRVSTFERRRARPPAAAGSGRCALWPAVERATPRH